MVQEYMRRMRDFHPSKYTPSPEKVIPEEADDPKRRAYAADFVDRIERQMDEADLGRQRPIPTGASIATRFQESSRAGVSFSLKDAYGAAKRRLLFYKDTFELSDTRQAVINLGDMYMISAAIENAIETEQAKNS